MAAAAAAAVARQQDHCRICCTRKTDAERDSCRFVNARRQLFTRRLQILRTTCSESDRWLYLCQPDMIQTAEIIRATTHRG